MFEARWTNQILLEVTRTLEVKFSKSPEKAQYREAAMREFFPDALVRHHEALISQMDNHPKDRHVLAAAVASGSDYVVTFNLKDFPAQAVDRLGVKAIGPSAFLQLLWGRDRSSVEKRLLEQTSAIGASLEMLLDRLGKAVPGFVELVRDGMSTK